MLIRGDARFLPLADACVDCCVTSPPYFGLRDYGSTEQIGLEPTPDAYVSALVAVFRVKYDGCWRFTRIVEGTAQMTKREAIEDEDTASPDDKPAYSDVVTLTGDIRWIVGAKDLLTEKPRRSAR